jgi:hypothetical protein
MDSIGFIFCYFDFCRNDRRKTLRIAGKGLHRFVVSGIVQKLFSSFAWFSRQSESKGRWRHIGEESGNLRRRRSGTAWRHIIVRKLLRDTLYKTELMWRNDFLNVQQKLRPNLAKPPKVSRFRGK